MIDTQKINDLSLKIKELVGSSPLGDIEKNIHALLKSAFTKMELVTREEFDVQSEVLRHTRQKLDTLETKLKDMESNLSNESDKPNTTL